jgi:hypothetical protein
MRLAGVDTFQHGDVVGIVLDGIGDAMQQLLARGRRHVAPFSEGAMGGLGGTVDIRCRAARDLCQHGAIDGRRRFEHLTRR